MQWPRWLLGLGCFLALAIGLPRASAALQKPPAATAQPNEPAPRIFHKARSFKIPFSMEQSERARLSEVQLWFSADRGGRWEPSDRATPDRTTFQFHAPGDGEYWFAVRTKDTRGRLYPSDEEDVEPRLKVVVDTTAPTLVLTLKERRGSIVHLHYEARDENLDLTKLHLQYQAEGATSWRSVPLKARILPANDVVFDAATADLLRIRGTIMDRAGNGTITDKVVKEGLPGTAETEPPGLDEPDEASGPPPITPIVRPANRSGPSPSPSFPRARPAPGPRPGEPPPLSEAADDEEPMGRNPSAANPSYGPSGGNGDAPQLLVGSPRFPLKYAVDDAGPGGPATVELWMTRDNGRNWAYVGQDPDRTSPFLAELPGDGVYGLRIVARSASGLGDRPPQAGEPPEVVVEVDTTPPFVRMGPAQLMPGNEAAVKITWKAEDAHLGPAGDFRTAPIARTASGSRSPHPGRLRQAQVRKLPPNLPGRPHFRIDVIDTLDNRGWAEIPENSLVVID
ncbi:MAG: hypothetical protein U0800_06100 [Isosphaeraceae bacterium]